MAGRTSRLATLVVAVLVASACTGSPDDPAGDQADDVADPTGDTRGERIDPTDREWILVELRGEPVLDDTVVDLTVTAGRVSGSAGCNRYMGSVEIDESTWTFSTELATTMMMCRDDVMAQEAAYLQALRSVTGHGTTTDELRLTDDGGTVVARFR